MAERVFEFDPQQKPQVKKLIEYDPYLDQSLDDAALKKMKEDEYANIIFTRQECEIKDGDMIGMDASKCYLYIKANEEFMPKAESKLKREIPGIKRCDAKSEEKVIAFINEEKEKGNVGFGSIFGG
ncbi:MAG: hypothetical protein QXN59_00175 [Candidatus Micrarchaeaceae archaeon]